MGNQEGIIEPEHYFRLSNGRILKNLYELVNALQGMDNETFAFHVTSEKNDFGNWIKHVFKDDALANKVYASSSKDELVNAIESRLFEQKKENIFAQLPTVPPSESLIDSSITESRYKEVSQSKNRTAKPKRLNERIVKAIPFRKATAKEVATRQKKSEARPKSQEKGHVSDVKEVQQQDLPLGKIDEILMKEKEIAKREEKIQEIEAHIEKELERLACSRDQKFFTREFLQGIAIGLLAASIGWLVYVKFFV